jgi:hypothetical protein
MVQKTTYIYFARTFGHIERKPFEPLAGARGRFRGEEP